MNAVFRESEQNRLFQRAVDIFGADYDNATQEMHEAQRILDKYGFDLAGAMLAYQWAKILDRLLLIEEEKKGDQDG